MRWSWRVEFYANGAFATDRTHRSASSPIRRIRPNLEVPYPDRELPRLQTAFQWLLAVPHWLVVCALLGAGWWSPAVLPGCCRSWC